MESCSIIDVQSIARKNPEGGALMVYTQAGCPHCASFLKVARSTVGTKMKIVQAPVEKAACAQLAEKKKIRRTPTAIWYDGNGKEKNIPIGGRSWDQIKQSLGKLSGNGKMHKSTPRRIARRRVRRANGVLHAHAR